MNSGIAVPRPSVTSFNREVTDRFGVLPNFFRTAANAPGLIEKLWSFAESAYLDNPLPSVFKERLFVHLSRFCEIRYCITRHVGFLVGLGRPAGDAAAPIHTLEQVMALLARPVPRGAELDAALLRLETHPGACGVPPPETQLELDLLDALTVMFLEPMQSERARYSARRCLGDAEFEFATALLAFVRTAHYWTETHPELACEQDMLDLMEAHPNLANLLLSDADARAVNTKEQLGRALLDVEKAQHKQAGLEERFRALVEASSDVVFRVSADWKQLHELRDRQFLPDGASSDQSWLERFVHSQDQARVMMAIEHAIQTRSAFQLEHQVPGNGGSSWTFSRAIPILAEDGSIIEWLGAATDITPRKRAEEALMNTERLASIGRLAATIAHEINNPLEAVTNLLFLVGLTDGLPAKAREQLEQADAELRRVAHITRQALGFYRESSAPAPTDVGQLMESTIDLLKGKILARRVSIEKQWRPTPCICAVAGELRQVFSNILVNSLDAADAGGTIKLRISTCTVRSRPGIRITFADNGKGIDSAAKHRIFEPLYTTKGTVGTGLGLWVSKQLVEKHQGLIQMRSSTNGSRKGSTFSVVLFCDL